MRLSMIAAVAQNHLIGKDNDLPWHLPDDMTFFKQTTKGHTIIMGRKSFEALGGLLPKRRHIVITRKKDYQPEGVTVVHSMAEAFVAAPHSDWPHEVFVTGGAEIYQMALSVADRLYITHVHGSVAGDTYFPPVDWQQWHLLSEEYHSRDEKHAFSFCFSIYDRK